MGLHNSPTSIREKINRNELYLERLWSEFSRLGFNNATAIARVMADKTGQPFFSCHRALLYMASSEKYFRLMEETIEKLKAE